jgi:hypothetical protein
MCTGLEAYISLLQRCWAQAPADRPTFHQVVRELEAMETNEAVNVANQKKFKCVYLACTLLCVIVCVREGRGGEARCRDFLCLFVLCVCGECMHV